MIPVTGIATVTETAGAAVSALLASAGAVKAADSDLMAAVDSDRRTWRRRSNRVGWQRGQIRHPTMTGSGGALRVESGRLAIITGDFGHGSDPMAVVDSDGAAMDSDDLAAAAGLHRLAAVQSDLGSVSDVAAAPKSERVAAVNSELAMEVSREVMAPSSRWPTRVWGQRCRWQWTWGWWLDGAVD